ncbi:hypothetical protein PCANC_06217 [Puccinia coronata f. sp. avenae]|uniref:Uncharacterized protein n=1 Tax=Puccinia coronata f. sp. avenae TaxID=200324 RepID=A0A2N5SJE6_9BASI|nr:hypothetical protein PCANC_17975 [Puccinia coronata f. sp. avenae]PLW24112.1 hypothetical protein PCASD_06720 [Puccinia coronata f. sp. avenae]PLW37890.1 hypothetical protein PCASD_05757 [Puccinia coronata f. sp. avenae]PLW44445.1 hypothetical protein PCANC_06217 [Puccinia coronata f. sp. avenae]
MHSRLAVLLGSLNLILAQSTDGPVINTPASVPQCLPSLLQFHGGVPPYTISAIPGGQVGAAPLVELGTQSGDSYTWIANLPAGTSTTLQIRDSRGNINYSQMFTIQPNSDSSCLKSGSTPSPTTPPAPGGGATPPSSGPPSATTGIVSAKPGNSTAGASGSAANGTTTPNATSSATGASANTTKPASPFVPSTTSNTSPVSPTTSASPSTPASAAASLVPASSHALLAAAVLATMALFA